jgi:hypothetical protein
VAQCGGACWRVLQLDFRHSRLTNAGFEYLMRALAHAPHLRTLCIDVSYTGVHAADLRMAPLRYCCPGLKSFDLRIDADVYDADVLWVPCLAEAPVHRLAVSASYQPHSVCAGGMRVKRVWLGECRSDGVRGHLAVFAPTPAAVRGGALTELVLDVTGGRLFTEQCERLSAGLAALPCLRVLDLRLVACSIDQDGLAALAAGLGALGRCAGGPLRDVRLDLCENPSLWTLEPLVRALPAATRAVCLAAGHMEGVHRFDFSSLRAPRVRIDLHHNRVDALVLPAVAAALDLVLDGCVLTVPLRGADAAAVAHLRLSLCGASPLGGIESLPPACTELAVNVSRCAHATAVRVLSCAAALPHIVAFEWVAVRPTAPVVVVTEGDRAALVATLGAWRLEVLHAEVDAAAVVVADLLAEAGCAARHAGLRSLWLGADRWTAADGRAIGAARARLVALSGPLVVDLARCGASADAMDDGALAALADVMLTRTGAATQLLTPLHPSLRATTVAALHAVARRPRCRLDVTEGACDDRLHRVSRSLYSASDAEEWFRAAPR